MRENHDEILSMVDTFSRLKRHGLNKKMHMNIKPAQVAILCCIFDNTDDNKKELKPSQISSILGVQQPTITPLLRSLEETKLIIRRCDDVDRRQVYYSLTEKSRELVGTYKEKEYKLLEGLFEHLGKDDSEKFVYLLKKSIDYFIKVTN